MLIPVSLNAVVLKLNSCRQIKWGGYAPRVSIIMETSRWSAALPCGINPLGGTHVRLYLRQHRHGCTHPKSSCSVLLMKSNRAAAVIHFGRHWGKEQQDYCMTVLANGEKNNIKGVPPSSSALVVRECWALRDELLNGFFFKTSMSRIIPASYNAEMWKCCR